MPFISSSEAKNAYFMSGEATNEIYNFLASRDFFLLYTILNVPDLLH